MVCRELTQDSFLYLGAESPLHSLRGQRCGIIPSRRTCPSVKQAALLEHGAVGQDHDGRLLGVWTGDLGDFAAAFPGPGFEHLG